MNRNNRGYQPNAEDQFAEAVARFEAGETIAQIVASYPVSMRDELTDMLTIVGAVENMARAPVPRPSAAKRTAAKRQFLAAAAQMRQEREAAQSHLMQAVDSQSVAAASRAAAAREPAQRNTAQRSTRRRRARSSQSWLDQLRAGLQGIFSVRALRLAPVIAMLAFVLLSTSTLVTMAQTSVPGDLTYSLKQWIRKQELELAPPDMRDQVRLEQERELAQDVAKAASRADANSAIIQAEDTQIYYGRTGRVLKIGGLNVVDRYQPDANAEVFREMVIQGDLEPGALVEIAYQIMPGQSDTVQGITLNVVAPPTKTPEELVAPSAATPDTASCTVSQPDGWVPYEVKAGDNLTFLASRGGTTVAEIMQVNCLDSEVILIGADLYVPAASLKTDRPILACGTPLPKDWVLYEVQPGDSLSTIAQRGGITVSELMGTNCLRSDTIIIGSKLYVPPVAEATPAQ